MSDAALAPGEKASHAAMALLPLMVVVLVVFLITGFAVPVLPLHVHQGLGFGTFVVGLVTGSQFAASIISRVWSGHVADSRGPKLTVIVGLAAAMASGVIYEVSLAFVSIPAASVSILLGGRALLGVAESFIITGAVTWGLALVGTESAGRVIAWIGMALFAALALGAPIGTTLYGLGGLQAVAIATAVVPLTTLILVAPLPTVAVRRGGRASLLSVLGAVWMPGFGAALSSVGFGAILAFGALMSAQRGWTPVWLVFSAFAVTLVLARTFLGHLPDKLGGARVALACLFVEATGLALIWLANGPVLAAIGAALTGFGYSLVYPGLGVEAVKSSPPESRGLATGAYTVCLDIALGLGSPALGLIAGSTGLGSVFLASTIAVLGGALVTCRILHTAEAREGRP
jgi:MFS family permease